MYGRMMPPQVQQECWRSQAWQDTSRHQMRQHSILQAVMLHVSVDLLSHLFCMIQCNMIANMMLYRPCTPNKALTLAMLHAGNRIHMDDEEEEEEEEEGDDEEGDEDEGDEDEGDEDEEDDKDALGGGRTDEEGQEEGDGDDEDAGGGKQASGK